jgi:hypothetical protein
MVGNVGSGSDFRINKLLQRLYLATPSGLGAQIPPVLLNTLAVQFRKSAGLLSSAEIQTIANVANAGQR